SLPVSPFDRAALAATSPLSLHDALPILCSIPSISLPARMCWRVSASSRRLIGVVAMVLSLPGAALGAPASVGRFGSTHARRPGLVGIVPVQPHPFEVAPAGVAAELAHQQLRSE